MEEKIKLSEILLQYLDFLTNPVDEKQQEINKMLSKIVVRQYVALEDKTKLMGSIIRSADLASQGDAIQMSLNIEVAKVIIGLIGGYCVNVENDLDITSLQLGVFDLIYGTGFVDYILAQGAEKDYNRFMTMVDNTLNFTNLFNLLQAFYEFDTENIEDFNKSIDKLKNTLTKTDIELLRGFTKVGSPEFNTLVDTLAEDVLHKTLGSDSYEEFKTTSFGLAQNIEESQKIKEQKDHEEEKEENTENIVA